MYLKTISYFLKYISLIIITISLLPSLGNARNSLLNLKAYSHTAFLDSTDKCSFRDKLKNCAAIQPTMRIGLIADVQYCNCDPVGDRDFRGAVDKLKIAVDTLNSHQVDFVLTLGDVTDRTWSSYDSVSPVFDSLTMNNYHTLGNHEFRNIQNYKKKNVHKRLNMPSPYYDFEFNEWKIIVLNTTELSGYATKHVNPELLMEYEDLRDSVAGKINDASWNGGISQTQLSWLRGKLDTSIQNNQQVIIATHMPLAPFSHHSIYNYSDLKNLLDSFPNVVAYVNGHSHRGNYAYDNNKHYLSLNGIIESGPESAFGILNVYPKKFELEGYGDQDCKTMKFKYDTIDVELLTPSHTMPVKKEFISLIRPVRIDSSINLSSFYLNKAELGYDNEKFLISNDSLFFNGIANAVDYNLLIKAISCNNDTTSSSATVKLIKSEIISLKEEDFKTEEIIIYPNPTKQYVTIDLKNKTTDVRVFIKDITGRRLVQHVFSHIRKGTFELPDKNGIYVVEVLFGSKSKVFKVVKR